MHSYFKWKRLEISTEQFNEDKRTSEEIIQGYGALLEDSVRLRLMSDRDIPAPLHNGAICSGVEAIEIGSWDDEEVMQQVRDFPINKLPKL